MVICAPAADKCNRGSNQPDRYSSKYDAPIDALPVYYLLPANPDLMKELLYHENESQF